MRCSVCRLQASQRHKRFPLRRREQAAGGLRVTMLSAHSAPTPPLLHSTLSAENMRREGFELSVSPPRVVLREEEGARRCHVVQPLAGWLLPVPPCAGAE